MGSLIDPSGKDGQVKKSLSQNRWVLAHFAESSEQNVPVPFSRRGLRIGSKWHARDGIGSRRKQTFASVERIVPAGCGSCSFPGPTWTWRLLFLVTAAAGFPAGSLGAEPGALPVAKTGGSESVVEELPRPESVRPVDPQKLEAAIARGVDFLIQRQNPDGSWGSARNTKGLNIYAPVPGAHHAFRTAVTAMCLSTLIELGTDSQAEQQALERGEAWLLENLPNLRRANPEAIYNNWGHAYALHALVDMHGRLPDDKKRRRAIEEQIRRQIDRLTRYECVDGGWCYYDFEAHTQRPSGSSISFVSATVLTALKEVEEIGIEVPDRIVQRGLDSIRRQRKPDFSYLYGEYLRWSPMYSINRPGGSLGRSQSCNFATRIWGDQAVTDEVLIIWLDRLFARNLWLDMGRKRPVPHESWFAVAGYFFYYGHYYAARCIELLEPAEQPRYQDLLATVLLPLQEKDGSWWDFPFYDYHQQYGTAFALMSLARCRKSGG